MRYYTPRTVPAGGELPGGRPLEPGRFVELTAEQEASPLVQRLLAERRLLPAPEKTTRQAGRVAAAPEKEGDA